MLTYRIFPQVKIFSPQAGEEAEAAGKGDANILPDPPLNWPRPKNWPPSLVKLFGIKKVCPERPAVFFFFSATNKCYFILNINSTRNLKCLVMFNFLAY